MRIIFRFCSQWGNLTTKIFYVQKNMTIKEMKKVIFELTSIEEEEQQLMITVDDQKVYWIYTKILEFIIG